MKMYGNQIIPFWLPPAAPRTWRPDSPTGTGGQYGVHILVVVVLVLMVDEVVVLIGVLLVFIGVVVLLGAVVV